MPCGLLFLKMHLLAVITQGHESEYMDTRGLLLPQVCHIGTSGQHVEPTKNWNLISY